MKETSFDIYSFASRHAVLSLDDFEQDAYLRYTNHTMKINSISFDVEIIDNNTDELLHWQNQTTQQFGLRVGIGNLVAPITKTFVDFTLPAALVAQGQWIRITQPGQYFFNSFFINNEVLFRVNWHNRDIMDDMLVEYCIICEISILE